MRGFPFDFMNNNCEKMCQILCAQIMWLDLNWIKQTQLQKCEEMCYFVCLIVWLIRSQLD